MKSEKQDAGESQETKRSYVEGYELGQPDVERRPLHMGHGPEENVKPEP